MKSELGTLGKQQGAALIMAIMAMMVIALVATMLSGLVRVGNESVAREVLATRALLSAHSGANRALKCVVNDFESGGLGVDCDPACETTYTWPSSLGGLSGCGAVVTCTPQSAGGATFVSLGVTGRCGSGADVSVRTLEIKARL